MGMYSKYLRSKGNVLIRSSPELIRRIQRYFCVDDVRLQTLDDFGRLLDYGKIYSYFDSELYSLINAVYEAMSIDGDFPYRNKCNDIKCINVKYYAYLQGTNFIIDRQHFTDIEFVTQGPPTINRSQSARMYFLYEEDILFAFEFLPKGQGILLIECDLSEYCLCEKILCNLDIDLFPISSQQEDAKDYKKKDDEGNNSNCDCPKNR